uniref:Protein TIC 214 n=1 Tax=Limonium aureum TaxID=1072387 RepID=A0A650AK46_9CARY|nr:hypothetical chloroplast RF1 [Limonium aureum]YP_009722559.1 hypothetical chloroplast RF1 [Limonium aureum]QGN73772.1 hypothetical chloroplast RF1 [Limonium aureum]QGN73784.1 hypothetical chloroplast RF1 [Limonium aureum]
MIFFLLGKLRNLYMKIINSVVVAGLYYGFFTTFSIGSSYFLLIRAIATEKEKGREGTVKRVAATTGFIMGQLIMLLSIYSKPLYLLLGRPHTITALTLPYLFVHLFLSNHYKFDSYNSLQSFSTQLVFLNNLIFPLFYHFMLPSSMLARSANIYMFRCNNKILFVISSFVSWLIGLSLFIKYVDMLFVRIRQRGFIRSIIRSNKYLNGLLSDLNVLLSRLRSNKYLNQLIIRVRSNKQLYILLLRFRSNKFMKSINVLLSRLRPSRYLVSDLKYLVSEFRYLMFQLQKSMHRTFTIILFIICIYSLGRAPSAFFTRKMIVETPRKGRRETIVETRGTKLEQDIFTEEGSDHFHHRWHPLFLLFNYKRWARPLRYIKNKKFENPVRNEMSQHFFFSGQENGHLRVSFTYPSHLANFMEMLEHKMYLSFFSKDNFVCDELDKFVCDELHHFDYWIHTNEKKLCSLRNEFTDRIEALDIGSPHLDVLEKKIRLCNNKTKKEYLPKIYDPFLNGSYRGIINQSFLPSIRNKQNKVYRILLFQEKTTGIKKIRKEVPRWPYQLASDVERARKKARKPIRQGKATLTGFHMRGRPKKRITFTKRKVDRPEDKQKGTRMGEFAKEVFDFSSSTTKNNDKNKNKKEIGALFYPRISDFRRNIITGSMRFQRRKTVVGRRLQVRAHSPLFFDVIVFYMQPLFDKVISRVIEISDRIQDIFFKITGIQLKNKRRSQRAEELEFYKSLGEELEKIDLKYKLEWEEELKKKRDLEDEIIEEDPRRAEEKERDRVLEIYDNVLFWEDPSIARTRLLLVQSKIRKWILLPSLILAKNIVRLLLLQKPEWAKDIRDMKREVHVLCNDNDMPIQRDDIFSKAWENEDRQLHIIIKNPFRLKPWHRSKRQPSGRDPMKKKNEKRKRFSYLTASGMETHRHYGAPNQLLSTAFSYFFAPIKKKSKKAIRKWSFLVLKMFKKRTKFLKVLKVLQELQKRIQSFIEKKKNSIINNQIFHKSSIQIRSMDRTNYSPTEKAEKEKKEKKAEREKKMKELTDKISTIRNEIKRITKDKKRTRKKNKRRNARLIRKPYLFIKWIGESIYTDIFWGIIPYTIKKIYRSIIKSLSRWMRIIKRFLKLTKKKKKKNTFEHISTIQKKLSLSHITHKMKIRKRRKRRARARVFFNLSLVSQNYVFYKLSQNQAINLYKLRSGLQYDGASLFLKNEIKDSFRRQGIISSELKHKKLQNSGMNRWKNLLKKNQWIKWLKSHYQYELSERKWSKLGPQEWRSEVNQHCRVENRNLRKRKQNSSKREKKVSLLENQNYHLQKTYRYEKRSYQSIYYQDKKDSDSYGSALQIHKPNLVDMGGSSPIQNYIRKDHFMKNTDRKYFDMKGLDLFDLKIHKEIKPPNQKRNLFDWMGMNEEIRNLPYSIPWFFPQIGFKKNEGFKKRPVFRQIHSLLTIGEEDYTKSEMQIARKTEEEDVYSPIDIDNFIRSGRKNLKKIHLSFQLDWGNTIGSFELWEKMDEFKPDRVPSFERLLSLDCGKNNQIARRGDMLFKLKKNAVDPNTLNNMMLWLSHCDGVKGLENGMWSLEPGRVSVKDVKDNVKLIMYQTIKISLIHAIQQKNKRDRENMDKNLFKVSIGLIMPKNRKKKNYDLLVPENILSSRRRRELRILSCLNARNSNGVDKNAVFCNGNRVKTCGQFLDKSQDLDRDKKNFMKFKFFFFLWPNYRLEDLACMNRYWFDTNNGSRFSMLRIHMYPRLNNGSLISMLRIHMYSRLKMNS